ncbi:DsbA family protein [Vibrio gangliei]|uniref:DsbA family protein n=1 Tax=Vibrio gangliei TaxID=2077090 RepID=UPI000D014584|nr:DsbA family protein [Vibrio gangliei]
MDATLYYIHDPMCSWCWGYTPTWEKLKAALPQEIKVEYLLGGLAPDNDAPMPLEMRQMLQQTWQRIESQLGTQFNYDYWQLAKPVRTTYPACRAVIAAQLQGKGEAMNTAIQEAYYLRAMTPHIEQTHIHLAQEIGLDVDRFITDRNSDIVEQVFRQQRSFCQQLGIASFPNLVLKAGEVYHLIELDYRSEDTTLRDIQAKLSSALG